MKLIPGKLYKIAHGCSLYRDADDVADYYWVGMTPNHKFGHIKKDTVVLFLNKLFVESVGNMCQILHNERTYLVLDFELSGVSQ